MHKMIFWQVTGIRKDPRADAHRIQVEEDKSDEERGYYMYPDLYGQPAEKEKNHLLFSEEQELLVNLCLWIFISLRDYNYGVYLWYHPISMPELKR
jgi:hypothetical protein